MDVQIVSIPHTGTRLPRDLLKDHGVGVTSLAISEREYHA